VVVVDELNNYYDPSIKEDNLNILRQYGDKVRIHISDICDRDFMHKVFEQEGKIDGTLSSSSSYPLISISHNEALNAPTGGFDVICHLAARAGVRPSIDNPFIYVHSNLEGLFD